MTTTLSILNRSGDITLTWDHADEAARENARREVQRLLEAGYTFFLADGTPADEIAAGGGTLIVRRLDMAEVVGNVTEAKPDPEPEPASAPDAAPRKRRGRPPKVQAATADRHVVAVRPLAGG